MTLRTTTAFVLAALAASPLAAGAADPPALSAERMIGSPVYNETNQRIGTLQDILIRPSGGESRLVVAVGDVVGHDKMVAVPLSRIVLQDGRLILAGGTKDALEKLPAFSYRSRSSPR